MIIFNLVITVDGCLIDDDHEKCDYLFEIDDPCSKAIYVELKGRNCQKAFDQLNATLGYLKFRHKDITKECYIVASKVCPAFSATRQGLTAKMKKDHNAKLFIYTTQKELKI